MIGRVSKDVNETSSTSSASLAQLHDEHYVQTWRLFGVLEVLESSTWMSDAVPEIYMVCNSEISLLLRFSVMVDFVFCPVWTTLTPNEAAPAVCNWKKQ